MRLSLNTITGEMQLSSPSEMRSLDIELQPAEQNVSARVRELGLPRFEQHGWIPVALLQQLAGDTRTEAWDADLAKMVDYARSKGWYDEETAAVRAHVV